MQRRIAGFIVIVFAFTNILFAYQPEKSVWDERHKQIQLASLSVPVPAVSAFSPRSLSLVKPVLPRPTVAGLPASIQTHVRIADRFEGNIAKRVLILQDVHQNQEAQKHLSGVLEALAAEGKQKDIVVGLEGAHGKLPYDLYRQFPDPALGQAVADSFFETGELTGPVYTALTMTPKAGQSRLAFYGVDDDVLYSRNVEAYTSARKNQSAVLKQLSSARKLIAKKKAAAFNPALKTFDQRVQMYRSGELSLADYLPLLSRGENLSSSVGLYLDAARLEKNIDFRRVEAERTYVLEKLTPLLAKEELENLLARSVQVQNGDETHASYYEFFKSVCARHNIDLSKTSAFNDYVRYVLLSAKIQPEALFTESRRLEEAMFAAVASNEAERALIKQDRFIFLAGKLVNFSLTPEEWAEYETSHAHANIACENFESFYRLADARNEKMIGNILAAATREKTGLVVLVAGGYHTTGISGMLKKKGVSFVTAVPKLTTVDTDHGSAYLSVFDREKTPIETIFSGRRLFLSDNPSRPLSAMVLNRAALSASEGTFDAPSRRLTARLAGPMASTLQVVKKSARRTVVRMKNSKRIVEAYIGGRPPLLTRFISKPADRARNIRRQAMFWYTRHRLFWWISTALVAAGGAAYAGVVSLSLLAQLSTGAGLMVVLSSSGDSNIRSLWGLRKPGQSGFSPWIDDFGKHLLVSHDQGLWENDMVFWLENLRSDEQPIRRNAEQQLKDSRLANLIRSGVSGQTSNQTIFLRGIKNGYYNREIETLRMMMRDNSGRFQNILLDLAMITPETTPDEVESLYQSDKATEKFLYKVLYRLVTKISATTFKLVVPTMADTRNIDLKNSPDWVVSHEIDPMAILSETGVEEAIAEAKQLSKLGANILVKIPAAAHGRGREMDKNIARMVRDVTRAGVVPNITLDFGPSLYVMTTKAFLDGLLLRLDDMRANGASREELGNEVYRFWPAVNSFFFSRLDADPELGMDALLGENNSTLEGKFGLSMGRTVHKISEYIFNDEKFTGQYRRDFEDLFPGLLTDIDAAHELAIRINNKSGIQPLMRFLAASTGTDKPAKHSPVLYIISLLAKPWRGQHRSVVNTMPTGALDALVGFLKRRGIPSYLPATINDGHPNVALDESTKEEWEGATLNYRSDKISDIDVLKEVAAELRQMDEAEAFNELNGELHPFKRNALDYGRDGGRVTLDDVAAAHRDAGARSFIDDQQRAYQIIAQKIQDIYEEEELSRPHLTERLKKKPVSAAPSTEEESLTEFLAQLEQEQKNPGSTNAEVHIYISDEHGTIDKFDALILHALRSVEMGKRIPDDFRLDPKKTYAEKLADIGLSLSDFKGQIFFHNLGDFMDRGPHGIKVFMHSMELIDAGLSDFIIGNHDEYVYANLSGFHLPFYETYNLYDYHDEFDSVYGDVTTLHREKLSTDTDVLLPSWWAKKLAEFTAYHEEKQKSLWSKTVDVKVNGERDELGKSIKGTGLFARVSPSLEKSSREMNLWNQLRGDNGSDVSVYTGVRAVGQVSLVWWIKLLGDFKEVYTELQTRKDFDANNLLPTYAAWAEAIRMMENDIIPVVRKDVQKHSENGEWWWRIFEAINSQNYTSPEWLVKDWLFHAGWGPEVLKELNDDRPEGAPLVTPANYLNNSILQDISYSYKTHFNLHLRDKYQNDALHSFLPVDMETGEFHFTYKKTEYRGRGRDGKPSIWDGLAQIAKDVKDEPLIFNFYEAISLVIGWYGDNTTVLKPRDIARAVAKFGVDHLADMNGFNRLFSGHIPFFEFKRLGDEKLGRINGFVVDDRLVFTDHGKGKKFGGRGGYVRVSPEGTQLFGYEHSSSQNIVANPRTMDGFTRLFNNTPIPRERFLTKVIEDVKARLAAIRAAMPNGVQSNLSIGLALFGTVMVHDGNPWGYALQLIGMAGMMLLAGMVIASSSPQQDGSTEIQKHYPNLVGKNVFEVAMEMALTPDLFRKLEEKAQAFEGADKVAWHEIMQRVAMGESIGGIGPLLSERFMKLTDLGAKVYAVAPLYDGVYFQRVKDGEFTIERLESGKYLRSVLEDTGRILHVKMYDGSVAHVKVWQSTYKQSTIYYLDAPEIFTVAYEKKEESDERTRQNWVLSRGQLYLAKGFNIRPDITIQSETPTVYANPRLFQDDFHNDPFFDNTIRIYNDHTPVPYAHPHLMLYRVKELLLDPIYYLMFPSKVTQGADGDYYVVPPETPLATEGNGASVDMTKVLVIASHGAYAVSKEHRNVMQRMPVLRDVANLVSHITNGVLRERWQAPEYANADKLTNEEILAVKSWKTDSLLSFIQHSQGKDDGWKDRVNGLTIVRFMRRITGYKRFDLINEILTESTKLDEFMSSDMMFILGGRVHQEDQWGRSMVNFLVWLLNAPADKLVDAEKINLLSRGNPARFDEISTVLNRLAQNPELLQKLRDRVVFFPNYNIYDAPLFVQGAHATVMMADKGQEAAATGFQKDQMNGSLVLAVGEEGAIDESVYFSQVERLEILATPLAHDMSSKARDEMANLAGNGFEIPSNGPDVYNTGKRTGPTARGLLDTLHKLNNVRKGRTPLGTEGHPEIYPMMMRNAINTTQQVSVERTAKDMLAFMSSLVRRSEHENNMYDLGVRQARFQHNRRPQLREQLLNARDGSPFEWSYLDGKVRHQPIYRHQGPVGHEAGILNFIEGFRQVMRMGRLGRWSILYHAADPNNNDLFRYIWHLLDHSEELKKSSEFIETLQLLELEMKSVATPILDLERTISGLQNELAQATDRTLIEALKSQLTEAQDQLTNSQDALIGQVYYLMGFLEGTVKSASALRPRTLEAIKDILPMGALVPFFFFGMSNFARGSWIAIAIVSFFSAGILLMVVLAWYVERNDWDIRRSPINYASKIRWTLSTYNTAPDEASRTAAQTQLDQLLAPVRKLGVRDLGRLTRTPAERRSVSYEMFIALVASIKSRQIKLADQIATGDVSLIALGDDSYESLTAKLEGYLKNTPDIKVESKVLLTPATYAKYGQRFEREYSRLTFVALSDKLDVKALASRTDKAPLRQVNVLFEDAGALPNSLIEALYALSAQDPAFRDRIVLYYLKQGFLAGKAFVVNLNHMVGFANLIDSQA